MKTLAGRAITPEFLIYLAGMQQVEAKTGLTTVQTAGFTGLLKSIGRISDTTLGDPFDLIFNPPALLDGQTPYASATPIPFDPARPLTWVVGDLTLPGRTGTVAGASASTVTLDRSEEHTSELQSLMRISYAVFCLKKKTKHTR